MRKSSGLVIIFLESVCAVDCAQKGKRFFGLAAHDGFGNLIFRCEDISSCREDVLRFISEIADYDLSAVHFEDFLTDFFWSLP